MPVATETDLIPTLFPVEPVHQRASFTIAAKVNTENKKCHVEHVATRKSKDGCGIECLIRVGLSQTVKLKPHIVCSEPFPQAQFDVCAQVETKERCVDEK